MWANTPKTITRLKFNHRRTKSFRNQGGKKLLPSDARALFQEERYKILTIMDIIVDSIYHECFDMLADEVGTGSSSQQVTPD